MRIIHGTQCGIDLQYVHCRFMYTGWKFYPFSVAQIICLTSILEHLEILEMLFAPFLRLLVNLVNISLQKGVLGKYTDPTDHEPNTQTVSNSIVAECSIRKQVILQHFVSNDSALSFCRSFCNVTFTKFLPKL